MTVQSKEASVSLKNILIDLMKGLGEKKMISSTIVVIILFLIHVKNKNRHVEEIKIKRHDRDKRKV